MIDHYETLQVSPHAEPEVIEVVYRRLAFKYHPDRNPGDGDAKMKALNAAYAILSNPERRREYDAERARRSERSHENAAPREEAGNEDTPRTTNRRGPKKPRPYKLRKVHFPCPPGFVYSVIWDCWYNVQTRERRPIEYAWVKVPRE